MTKATTDYIERLQPSNDSLLPWFSSSKELLNLTRMLIPCCWDLGGLTIVAWITNQLFTLRDLEIQRILIKGCLIFLRFVLTWVPSWKKVKSCVLAGLGPAIQRILSLQTSTTTSYNTPAPWCLWEALLLFRSIQNSFVSLWTQSTVLTYILFELNRLDLLCFQALMSLGNVFDSISAKLLIEPHLPYMTCSVSYNLSQYNVIMRWLSMFSLLLF